MQDRRSRWEKMDEGGNEAAAGAADSLSQRAGVHEGAASSPPLQELLSALITEGLCSHRAGANLKTSHCDTLLNNPNQNALNSQAPFQVISEFAFEYFIEDKTAIAHYSTALDEASAKQHYGVFVATTMSTSIDLDVFTHFGSNSNQPGLNPHVGELGCFIEVGAFLIPLRCQQLGESIRLFLRHLGEDFEDKRYKCGPGNPLIWHLITFIQPQHLIAVNGCQSSIH
ncbi:unnamed protein product [Mesocestoides corti]|uniref:Uncharacterized protein n=1 Tax=Mesocestoides corti TaxID=53468 RepID=A0A0R3UAW0_MESCO|nr:unnamed protein product [Mesocestoides corti]